jgi:hypothetical protein
MDVMACHQRMAELYELKKQRRLTDEEAVERDHCQEINVKFCWHMARLYELSYLAHCTQDKEWQHSICEEIDQMKYTKFSLKSGPT